MSLSKTRLAMLLSLAERAEDEAKQGYAQAQRRADEQQGLQAELARYLEDYERRLPARPSPALLDNQRLFTAKLSEALKSQAGVVERAGSLVEQARKRWLETRREVQRARHLFEQGAAADLLKAERARQREMDDFAASRHALRGTTT